MKQAIIVVYHGSHHEEYNDKTSTKLTNKVKELYPDYEIYEVFTSYIVQKRLENKRFTFKESLEDITNKGINNIFVLTTNLIHGSEFDVLLNELAKTKLKYKVTPALFEKEETLNQVSKILTKPEQGIHLFVGHGSKRKDNFEYSNLETTFVKNNIKAHHVCVIDGKPTYEEIEYKLDKNQDLYIYPLMFIAGYHANKDVQGLAKQLEGQYKKVQYINTSLGMIESIRNLYLANLAKIINEK